MAAFSDLVSRTGALAPAALFLASFIEYVVPPFPGDLVVLLGAWYAVQGVLSWPVTFAAVTAGAVAGAWVDHRVGRALGARLDAGAARHGPLTARRLARFVDAYRRHGAWLLVANRFLPGVRAFVFLAAGAAGIPLARTLLLGGISAALWNALLLAAGALVARSQDDLLALFDRYTAVAWTVLGAGALVLAGALAWWRWRRRRAHAEGR